MIPYEEVRRTQTSSMPAAQRALGLAGKALLMTALLTVTGAGNMQFQTTGTHTRIECRLAAAYVNEADRITEQIQNFSQNQDMRDEDEVAPSVEVTERIVGLIRDASRLVRIPYGQVSIFFGEANVTWRAGNKIVRLASFADRPSLIQTGSLAAPLGSFQSEPSPTAERLAERLNYLASQDDPEGLIFPG